ncbi:MAG: hypothetical protein O3B31_09155 [Chloroflexi bacterium]|nr:hypothetical protein [Chloroflexota bacterium]MDA1003495.1 hypothetical protein [Chloroflexota bacterium]
MTIGVFLLLLGVPALVVRLGGIELPIALHTFVFGLGILGAAFVLGAAGEAAEHDLPRSLSLAILAFVAVLPEYAVDLLFAWRAGTDPTQAQYAVANMTGGNRLLIGVGWAGVLAAFFFIHGGRTIRLPRSISVEIAVLVIASFYSLLIPLKGNISLIDTVVLFSLMGFYLYRIAGQARVEPMVGGPMAMVTSLSPWRRRSVVVALFAYAGTVILASAEPFADGLIHTGVEFGIDEFLLVQWLAPLASESPEFLAAIYLVWRGNASAGLTMLIASKVNQWTLLIGSLAVAFSISGQTLAGLPMDGRQREEVLLTAAQSLFAVMLILDRRLSPRAAIPLFGLFVVQFVFFSESVRLVLSGVYFVIAAGLLLQRRTAFASALRAGLFASPAHFARGDREDDHEHAEAESQRPQPL